MIESKIVGPYRINLIKRGETMFELIAWRDQNACAHENYLTIEEAMAGMRAMRELCAVWVAQRALGLGKVTVIDGDGTTITISSDYDSGTVKIT